MLSIYEYSEASQFLRDIWNEKRKRNPAFSERAWARTLGFRSNASLSLILHGKRRIPKARIPRISASIGLGYKESLYFEALVGIGSAKTPEEKEYYYSRLNTLTPKEPLKRVEVEAYRYLGDPLHTHILELSELKAFNEDPRWIQKRLRQSRTAQEIAEAIARLLNLGLLKRDSDGTLRRTHQHLSTKPDFLDRGVQLYHKSILQQASECIGNVPVSEREYGSYTLNITKDKVSRAKELIREFAEKFISEIEAPSRKGEETYQMSLQFFPVTGEST